MFALMKPKKEQENIYTIKVIGPRTGIIPYNKELSEQNKNKVAEIITNYSIRNSDYEGKLKNNNLTLHNDVITPAMNLIADYYPEESLEFAAQLYAYYKTIPQKKKDPLERFIRAYCKKYFYTEAFASSVAEYINDICFSCPTRYLDIFVKMACMQVSAEIAFVKDINEKNEIWRSFFNKPGVPEQLQQELKVRQKSMLYKITPCFKETFLKTGKTVNDEQYKKACLDIANIMGIVVILPKQQEQKLAQLIGENYDILSRIKKFYDEKYSIETMHSPERKIECGGKLLTQYLEKKGNIGLDELNSQIEREYDDTLSIQINEMLFPSVIRLIRTDIFDGEEVRETRKCFKGLMQTQGVEDESELSTSLEIVRNNGLTAEELYDSTKKLTSEKELKSDGINKSTYNEQDQDLMRVSGECDSLLQEILEDAAAEQKPLAPADDEEKKNDEQDQKPVRKRKAKKRKFDLTKTYVSPKKKKKKKMTMAPIKDTAEQPAPQPDSEDILISVGVLRGIDFRLDEITSLVKRLTKVKTNDDHVNTQLSELKKQALAQQQSLSIIAEAEEWTLSEVNQQLLACDEVIGNGNKLLQHLEKEKGTLNNFDAALWKLVEKESLVSGKGWGGTIDKKLGGKFEKIEALYHGRRFNPKKQVTIDGKKRNLKMNETLVFYVTEHSTTDAIKYCMSIKLWNSRDPEDPAPQRRNARIYSIGNLVKSADRIDVDNWKCTGKNMAVLHVQ
ncbi:hypothetical protein [uncultured Sneathiella sp.]|uniref:hypothetical protein n=1 Tax=uncultured Sneathiella sp. TaxID=879315 RepID=UPI0030EDCC81|tara:strand:- start:6518 stop:8713 length:2196 start_codon:yes stop_codon:yes gene_type:complete